MQICKAENIDLIIFIDAYATFISSDKHRKISKLNTFIEAKHKEIASYRNLKMHNLQFGASTS